MVERQFSAGGVVYRTNPLEIILIKPTGKDTWQLPKGWIDPGETTEQAAIREVREEAGVDAQIEQKIDTIKVFFKDKDSGKQILKMVTFYTMPFVSGDTSEHTWETEEVIWVSPKEAIEKLTYKSEKEVVEKAIKIIESTQSTLF